MKQVNLWKQIKTSNLSLRLRVGISLGFFLGIILISLMFLLGFPISYKVTSQTMWGGVSSSKVVHAKLSEWVNLPISSTDASKAWMCYVAFVTLSILSGISCIGILGIFFYAIGKSMDFMNKVSKFMFAIVIVSVIAFAIFGYFAYEWSIVRSSIENSFSVRSR
ncbi:MAG: hypothetical protein HRT98_00835 [Mycoplasmatales bacterium]|nr:hypothetical protein [Mycoplasmatales bacterium]